MTLDLHNSPVDKLLRLLQNLITEIDGIQSVRDSLLDALTMSPAAVTASNMEGMAEELNSKSDVGEALSQLLFGRSTADRRTSSVDMEPLVYMDPMNYYEQQIVPIQDTLETASSVSFDVVELDRMSEHCPLSTLGYWVLRKEGLIDSCNLDEARLINLLLRVEDGYPENPYHNRLHVADVLQKMYYIMTRPSASCYRNKVWLLASYFACIIHDYQHLGVTNDFLVESKHALAVRYNDQSPNENHHVAAAFEVLFQPNYHFVCNMHRKDQEEFRHLVIDLVLATDMTRHLSILTRFHAVFRPQGVQSGEGHDDRQHVLVLQLALKCADLGHVAASEISHRRWVSQLESEFFLQGDLEKAQHLSESPLMQERAAAVLRDHRDTCVRCVGGCVRGRQAVTRRGPAEL